MGIRSKLEQDIGSSEPLFYIHPAQKYSKENKELYLLGLAMIAGANDEISTLERWWLREFIVILDIDVNYITELMDFALNPDDQRYRKVLGWMNHFDSVEQFLIDCLCLAAFDGTVDRDEKDVIVKIATHMSIQDKAELYKGLGNILYTASESELRHFFARKNTSPQTVAHVLQNHELQRRALVHSLENKTSLSLRQLRIIAAWYEDQANFKRAEEFYRRAEAAGVLDVRDLKKRLRSLGLDCVLVPGGSFMRWGQTCTLTSFYMARFLISQALYERIMTCNPSRFKADDLPVEQVCWYDALRFCNALSRDEGLDLVYSFDGKKVSVNWSANGYRLPSEAEWEYAARGGAESSSSVYAGGNEIDELAWYSGNSNGSTQPIARKKPNGLGIYDLSGNVWEWCWDWGGQIVAGLNPHGPDDGTARAVRGGAWNLEATFARCDKLFYHPPEMHLDNLGIRVVRNAETERPSVGE